MLDKLYFVKGLKKLSLMYKMNLGEQEIMLWYDYFKDYNEKEFKFAVEEYIKTEKFSPNVATLRAKIEGLKADPKDNARAFESMLFKYDTDTTKKYFEKMNDLIAVQVIESNYKIMRECKVSDVKMVKAQLREQYLSISLNTNKKTKIKNNDLAIDFQELKSKMLIE
jgi:predicted nucleotidyltransferase